MADDENKGDLETENASSAPTTQVPDVSEDNSVHGADEKEKTIVGVDGKDLLESGVAAGVATDRSVSDVETVTRKRFDGVEVVFVSQDTQTTSQESSTIRKLKLTKGDSVGSEGALKSSADESSLQDLVNDARLAIRSSSDWLTEASKQPITCTKEELALLEPLELVLTTDCNSTSNRKESTSANGSSKGNNNDDQLELESLARDLLNQGVEEPIIDQGQTDIPREQSGWVKEFKEREAFFRDESLQLNLDNEKVSEEAGQDPQEGEFEANEKYVEYDPNAQEEEESEGEEDGLERETTYLVGDDVDAETLVTEDSGVPPLRELEGLDGCETVGPPRILRFNRESSKPELDYPPLTDREKEDGIFGGDCDFCGNAIKSYPDMKKQLYKHSREIFCCDDYQMFMQFALQKPFGKKYDVDVQKFVTSLLDIQPHAPYNKQARKAAKEKAAMRMRERELERQKKAVTQQQPQQQQQQQQTYQQAAQKALKVINFSLGSKKCAEQGYIVDAKPQQGLLSSLPLGAQIAVDLSSDIPLTERSVPLKNQFEQRFYETTKKKQRLFYVFFDDGTGTVYYKSGRPCIVISTVQKPKSATQKSQHGSKSERDFASQSKTHRSITQTSRAASRKTEGIANTRRPTNASLGLAAEMLEESERRMRPIKLQYVVLSDEPRAAVLAVFMPDGNAACYDSNRKLRLHLSPFGGILFGDNLSRKRKWTWHDFAASAGQDQLAPPLQPVFLPIGNALSLKITNQHLLWLTFRSGKYNVRLNVGVRLKITGAQKSELPKISDKTRDLEYLNDMQIYTQSILNRVNNLLKYKNEELAEKLPPPLYLSHQMEKRHIQGPPKYGSKHKQAGGTSPHRGLLSQSVDFENSETIRT